ncbi:uncharacterized protein TRIVIDRAFT_170552, partial [Trichoderma virens Gv29-8]
QAPLRIVWYINIASFFSYFIKSTLAIHTLSYLYYEKINTLWSNSNRETAILAIYIFISRQALFASALFEAADELWPP